MTAAASVLSKGVALVTMLISVPLTLDHLGTERFGLWLTLSSLVLVLGFADLGVGNGLLNAVSESHGRDDRAAIRRHVSSAFGILGAIAVVILVLFWASYPHVSWADVLNVKSATARAEAGPAIAALVCCFAAAIPATIVQRTQLGLQSGFLASVWQVAGSVLSLVTLILLIELNLGLVALVLAVVGTPVLVACVNGLVFFGGRARDLAPRWRAITRDAARRIAGTGGLFLVLQLAMSAAYLSDSIVIARILGAEAVPSFAVPDKVFGIIPLLLGMVLMPLWPAYSEAIARRDVGWVRRVFRKSVLISVGCACVLVLVLGLGMNQILRTWVGSDVVAPTLLVIGLCVWKVLEAWGVAVGVFLNGTNTVRLQAIIAALMASTALVLKIVFVYWFGVSGVVWGTVVAYTCISFIPVTLMLPKLLAKLGTLSHV